MEGDDEGADGDEDGSGEGHGLQGVNGVVGERDVVDGPVSERGLSVVRIVGQEDFGHCGVALIIFEDAIELLPALSGVFGLNLKFEDLFPAGTLDGDEFEALNFRGAAEVILGGQEVAQLLLGDFVFELMILHVIHLN